MIKVSIQYPNQEEGRFDHDYYLGTHMPMALRLLGSALKGYSVETGLNGGPPDSAPPFFACVHFLFETPEAFYAAFLPHADALQSDIAAYTDVAPVIQIGEVRMSG